MPMLVATGCSSGLGLAALALFLRRVISLDPPPPSPWQIVAGYRTEPLSDAQHHLAVLCQQHPHRLALEWLPLDLASSASVRAFARSMHALTPTVDTLLLNAALWTAHCTPVRLGEQDWTQEAVVNALSQHLLVTLLEPLLAPPAAPDHRSRIVVTTSKLHSSVASLDDLLALLHPPAARAEGSTGKSRYAASKALQLLSASYLASSLHPRGVEVVAVSPGFVPSTGLSRAQGAVGRWVMRNVVGWLPFAVSGEEGAARIARCLPLRPPSSSPSAAAADELSALLSAAPVPTPLLYLALPSPAPLPAPAEWPQLGGAAQLLVEEAAAERGGWEDVGRRVLGPEGWEGVGGWEWGGEAEEVVAASGERGRAGDAEVD